MTLRVLQGDATRVSQPPWFSNAKDRMTKDRMTKDRMKRLLPTRNKRSIDIDMVDWSER